MQAVPLKPLPNQSIQIQLGGQNCLLRIYQLAYGLFMDVSVDNTLIVGGVICWNLTRIVRSLYLGFSGDFMYVDNQGTNDPIYTGLGSQFSLIYLDAADLPPGVG